MEGWVHRRDQDHSHAIGHHLWSPTQTSILHGRQHGNWGWGTWAVLGGSPQSLHGTQGIIFLFLVLVQVDLLVVVVAPALLPLLVEVEVLVDAVAPGPLLLPLSQG